MGDFSEHVLFGALFAFVIFHFSGDLLQISSSTVIISSLALLVGSVLPDIDHKKSKVHRSARAAVSLGSGGFIAFLFPASAPIRLLVFLVISTLLYLSFKLVTIRHRGYTHSISFAVLLTSLGVIAGLYTIPSIVPGLALGLGLASHLLLDTEIKLR